jgi:hypothetical protein
MAIGLRVEDRLDGAANFNPWKERIVSLLQECELWDIVNITQTNHQSSNENRKMVLREKLKGIKMTKTENVNTYLTKITQVRDELGVVGEVIVDNKLVRTSLNGVSKQWVVFVEGIFARENLPKWDRLWDNFIQEETRRGYVHGNSSNGNDEENVALATKNKKKSLDYEVTGYRFSVHRFSNDHRIIIFRYSVFRSWD